MYTLLRLFPSVSREVLATLCASLPPLIADTPEARASRDEAAMAAIAQLHGSADACSLRGRDQGSYTTGQRP